MGICSSELYSDIPELDSNFSRYRKRQSDQYPWGSHRHRIKTAQHLYVPSGDALLTAGRLIEIGPRQIAVRFPVKNMARKRALAVAMQ